MSYLLIGIAVVALLLAFFWIGLREDGGKNQAERSKRDLQRRGLW